MKVLMLGWELPPYHTGGLGVVCYQMCQNMAQSGIDIEFVLPYDAPFSVDFMKIIAAHPQSPQEVLSNASAYAALPTFNSSVGSHANTYHNVMFQQRRYFDGVAKLLPLKEFDVIHAHDWLTFKAAMLAKQQSGKPLIAHVHATEYDRSGGGFGNPLIREIEYSGLMMADQIIAVSNNTKNTLIREYDIPADKISVAHNALTIEPTVINESESAYSYLTYMKSHGYKVVLSAGRLTLQKGLTFLLRAAKEVIARNDKTIFLIVGGGEQYHELIEQTAELGISEHVVFSGYLNGTGKEWRDAFRLADLFVMPSVSEPFGITPLEAIGFGSPALISKQSGVSELLANALKIDFWDEKGMAEKILAVVESNALRNTLYQNSLHEYENINWSNTTEKIQAIYKTHMQKVSV